MSRAGANRTMLNFGADAPPQPRPSFAATLPLSEPPAPNADDQQETTVLDPRDGPGPSTTKPPPFPEVGSFDSGEDEEMTRMEQVPPEVLAQLMARAAGDAPAPPAPAAAAPRPPAPTPAPFSAPTSVQVPSSPWSRLYDAPAEEDVEELTRLGDDVVDLVAWGNPATNATQLGVPAIPPRPSTAAPPLPTGERRHMATQLGIPQQPPGSIPSPPRPLSSIPPPPAGAGSAAPPSPQAPQPPRPASGTLSGVHPPAQPTASSVPPHGSVAPSGAVHSAPPQPLQPGQPAPRRVPNANPTLLGGVLSAALAQSTDSASPPQPGQPMPQQPHAPQQQAPHAFPPGPAGAPPWAGAAAPAQPFPQAPAPQAPFPPAPLGAQPAFTPPMAPAPAKKSGVPLLLVLLLLGGIVGGGGFFALRWHQGRSNPALMASIDAAGSDLELVCPTCADGSTISLGGAPGAAFAGNRARLILPTPLEVGDQALEGVLQLPNESPTPVKLTVSVEFRLDVDTSTLHAYPPALTLRPKLSPGGRLTIAGKPATGDVTIPVGDAATGARETVVKVPLDVAYRYERDGIPAREGTLHQELNILPLRLFSPKDGGFTADATVVVQGQAPPGIDVHVADQIVKPDDKGIFQLSRPLVVGENTIPLWLSRPEPGPSGVSRGLTLHIVRAASAATLWTEAKAKLDAAGAGALATLYANAPASLGGQYAFAGAVVEAQTQRGEIIALIDGSAAAANLKPTDPLVCTASSCLLRVVAAGTTRFAKGERVRGIGRSVTPRDPKTPEVEAMLLLSTQESR